MSASWKETIVEKYSIPWLDKYLNVWRGRSPQCTAAIIKIAHQDINGIFTGEPDHYEVKVQMGYGDSNWLNSLEEARGWLRYHYVLKIVKEAKQNTLLNQNPIKTIYNDMVKFNLIKYKISMGD